MQVDQSNHLKIYPLAWASQPPVDFTPCFDYP